MCLWCTSQALTWYLWGLILPQLIRSFTSILESWLSFKGDLKVKHDWDWLLRPRISFIYLFWTCLSFCIARCLASTNVCLATGRLYFLYLSYWPTLLVFIILAVLFPHDQWSFKWCLPILRNILLNAAWTLPTASLQTNQLILVLFVRLFDLCLFGFVGFLFLLVSGKGCGLWLWHSLDFSLTFSFLFFFFFFFFFLHSWEAKKSIRTVTGGCPILPNQLSCT